MAGTESLNLFIKGELIVVTVRVPDEYSNGPGRAAFGDGVHAGAKAMWEAFNPNVELIEPDTPAG